MGEEVVGVDFGVGDAANALGPFFERLYPTIDHKGAFAIEIEFVLHFKNGGVHDECPNDIGLSFDVEANHGKNFSERGGDEGLVFGVDQCTG